MVHGLEQQYGDEVEFIYVNIDDPNSKPLKQAYGYRYQPHIFLVDQEGTIVNEWVGYAVEGDLTQALDSLVGDS